jgi:hypothetical protein
VRRKKRRGNNECEYQEMQRSHLFRRLREKRENWLGISTAWWKISPAINQLITKWEWEERCLRFYVLSGGGWESEPITIFAPHVWLAVFMGEPTAQFYFSRWTLRKGSKLKRPWTSLKRPAAMPTRGASLAGRIKQSSFFQLAQQRKCFPHIREYRFETAWSYRMFEGYLRFYDS